MSQKIYAVVLESWWDCCDTGHDVTETKAIFTTKDLAVKFIVEEIEGTKKCFIDKWNRELESCKNESYIEFCERHIKEIESFEYDVWKIRSNESIDVTDLVGHEWWGDYNVYHIDEYELLDELPE